MRELTEAEVVQVAGGGTVSDAAAVGTAIGGALGVAYAAAQGATGTAVLASAGIGGAYLGGVFAIGAATYVAGQWLNDNTPLQSWIGSGIDALTGGGGGGGGGGRFVYENLSD